MKSKKTINSFLLALTVAAGIFSGSIVAKAEDNTAVTAGSEPIIIITPDGIEDPDGM